MRTDTSAATDVAREAIAAYETWESVGRPIEASSVISLDHAKVASLIDHTQLRPSAGEDSIRELCTEAVNYGFASVCVHSGWTRLCAELLSGTQVMVCTVAGFAQGANMTAVKQFEAQQAIAAGASEIDMVINVGRLKDGDYDYVADDIAAVVDVASERGAKVKTIIEACLLADSEKAAVCALAKYAGADFVKTSTGFNGPGATASDVMLMRFVVGGDVGVKAAGGIHSYDDVLTMVGAGASRIGASAGVQIMQGLESIGGVDVRPTVRDSHV